MKLKKSLISMTLVGVSILLVSKSFAETATAETMVGDSTQSPIAVDDSLTASPRLPSLGANQYLIVEFSRQEKYTIEKTVEPSDCESNSSGNYGFAAAGRPSVVNTVVSIKECQKKDWDWNDECRDVEPGQLGIPLSRTVTKPTAQIFKSQFVSGKDNCMVARELFMVKGSYDTLAVETTSEKLSTYNDIEKKLNSF